MSKELKHTKGEWTTTDYYNSIECDKQQICAMFTSKPTEERIANAQLISSAPQLLEQLIKLVKWNEKYPNDKGLNLFQLEQAEKEFDAIILESKQAINKATS